MNRPRDMSEGFWPAPCLSASGTRSKTQSERVQWLPESRQSAPHTGGTPAANCLKPLLAALGWSGSARALHEAAGSGEPVANLGELRRVLDRLNYATFRIKSGLDNLALQHLPALLETRDGDVWVLLSRQGEGGYTAFKGGSGALETIAAAPPGAALYAVAPAIKRDAPGAKTYSGWSHGIIAGESRSIRMLCALTLAVNLVALAVPVYLIAVFDRAVATKSLSSLVYLFGGVLLAIALESVLREMRARGLAYLGVRLEGQMMTAAFKRLLLLPAGLVENASVSAQIARLKLFESVRDVFSGPLAGALLDLPFILIFVLAVFLIGGQLGWLIVIFILLLVLLTGLSVPAARRHAAKAGDLRSEAQEFLDEFTRNHDAVRQCGAEAEWVERYRRLSEDSLLAAAKMHRAQLVEQTLAQSLMLITGGAVIGCGAYLVMQGAFTAGALLAMMALVWRVLGPIQTALLHLGKLSQAAGVLRQLDQLMRLDPEYRPEGAPTVPRALKGPVELQAVAMRYSPRAEPALRGVSMHVPHKAFIAVTGHAGSGKSTLLKVIAQLYLPQTGAVLFDGMDYRQFDARFLRNNIGFVPQSCDLFAGSIADNVRFGCPEAGDEAITAMLHSLGAGAALAALDGGIHAPLDLGDPMTGSDAFRQKIMLARAFTGQPEIYLLDEPGARLSCADDEALRDRLLALKGKATIILATTRPAFMTLADRLIVLKSGQIVAQDTPDTVIAALAGERVRPKPETLTELARTEQSARPGAERMRLS